MPRMKEDTIVEFLQEPHIGVIASTQKNSLPYTVPVGWLYDKDSFWLTGTFNRVWCKHLIDRPGCSPCIEALAPVAGHVGIEATAELYRQPPVHRRCPTASNSRHREFNLRGRPVTKTCAKCVAALVRGSGDRHTVRWVYLEDTEMPLEALCEQLRTPLNP